MPVNVKPELIAAMSTAVVQYHLIIVLLLRGVMHCVYPVLAALAREHREGVDVEPGRLHAKEEACLTLRQPSAPARRSAKLRADVQQKTRVLAK